MTVSALPNPSQLVEALRKLEAELLKRAIPADESARAVLLERVKRIRTHASHAITSDPEGSTTTILALLNEWAQVLTLLRRLDLEVGGKTWH